MFETDFIRFPKISRYTRPIIITEKIDGTNAQIWIDEDGQIMAGSRNRWLTPEKDNFGFAVWVEEYANELVPGLGPGRHYGEWWGQGIQRNYGLNERRFSLFNVQRWNHQNIPDCCRVIPTLAYGELCFLGANRGTSVHTSDPVSTCMTLLIEHGSQAAPGFDNAEGIVICHTAQNVLFKKTFWGDAKGKGR